MSSIRSPLLAPLLSSIRLFSSSSSSSKPLLRQSSPLLRQAPTTVDPHYYMDKPANEQWIEDNTPAQFGASDRLTSPSTLSPGGGGLAALEKKLNKEKKMFDRFFQTPESYFTDIHTPERLNAMADKYSWVNFDRFAEYLHETDKMHFDNEHKMVGNHWTPFDQISPKGIELEYQQKKAEIEQMIEDYKLRSVLTNRIFIDSGRIVQVTAQGKQRSLWTMMIAGDENGTIGFGFGKAEDGGEARQRAWASIKKNLLFVPLVESRTVLHGVTGHHGVCNVAIRPLPRGHGLTAGPIPRAIFEACGIRDINANVMGRALRKHQALAVFDALKNQSSIRELGIARGLNAYRMFDPGLERYRAPTRSQMTDKFNDLQLRLMALGKALGFEPDNGKFVKTKGYDSMVKKAKEDVAEEGKADPFRGYLNEDTTPISAGVGIVKPPRAVPTAARR